MPIYKWTNSQKWLEVATESVSLYRSDKTKVFMTEGTGTFRGMVSLVARRMLFISSKRLRVVDSAHLHYRTADVNGVGLRLNSHTRPLS
jgi:hypothetical protein